jgi:membrane protein DedA with SNARE-associated domain
METFIAHFGLVAIFLGAIFDGDLVLLLAGVIAHMGLMNLWVAMGFASAGCFTGDFVCYVIGRVRSDAIRNSRVYRKVGPTVERVADRVGAWQIVGARFMYGTRVATMLFWGAHRLPVARFVLINGLGCAMWGLLLGLLGYSASSGAAVLLGRVKRAELWLLGAIALFVVVFLIIRWLVNRHREQTAPLP